MIRSGMLQSVSFYSEDHLLAGDLYLPEGLVFGEARPGIVLCNGYTATKDLYLPETAAVLNHAGCVVLSFDYTGWGESEGSRHRLAPFGRVMDTHAAVTFIGLQSAVDQNRVGVLGWSYGGATAIWLTAVDERLRCAVSIGGVGDGARWMRSVRDVDEWAGLSARSATDRSARVLEGRSELAPRPEILKLDPNPLEFPRGLGGRIKVWPIRSHSPLSTKPFPSIPNGSSTGFRRVPCCSSPVKTI